jgi:N-acyl-D-amino-acid deacylase
MAGTLIVGGKVVDGTGNPWTYSDVAIEGDRIVAAAPAGRLDPTAFAEVIEATGHVVCPGFIDVQSHSILPLMVDGRCLSKVKQGVTTEIMGEAWTPAPAGGGNETLEEAAHGFARADRLAGWIDASRGWTRFRHWLEATVEAGVSPNVGSFLGGGTLRSYVKGMETGPATADELDRMRRVMAEAMADGAFGVSYALIYPPDTYVGTDEIVKVCEVVGGAGGVYITHIRDEADRLLEALDEALEIGRRASVPVEIYHLKASGRANWPKMPEVIRRIDAARAGGLDVTADMYPYVASGTGLASVLPPWLSEGGRFFENLRDPAIRARVLEEVRNPSGDWEAMGTLVGAEGILLLGLLRPEHRQYLGRRLADVAAERSQGWAEAAIDLLVAEGQRVFSAYYSMSETNLRLQLAQPWVKISTDAGGVDPAWAGGTPTHPRAYGTYPRVLGKYVREEKALGLEDAVRKMTSAVADRLGLRERGLIRAGMLADVVVFDPATIADKATFESTHQLAVGVRDVWVNGSRVLAMGDHTGAKPGRFVVGAGSVAR